MNHSPKKSPEHLERAIHQTLRSLPSRRAPRSLELRVLAELERLAALPWWKKSFAHWPLAARSVFLLLSVALVKLAIMAAVWIMTGFDSAAYADALSAQFTWVQTGLSVARSMWDLSSTLFSRIPPLWLYGTAAIVAALYAALFGLGAAAYRTLYASR
jgi:hypothetical protein